MIARQRAAVPRQRRAQPARTARAAGANPWGAGTLEWATAVAAAGLQLRGASRSSHGREPLWEPAAIAGARRAACAVDSREVLVTTVLDADARIRATSFPTPTIWPFVRRGGDDRAVHRLDLHAVGGRLGLGAGRRSR